MKSRYALLSLVLVSAWIMPACFMPQDEANSKPVLLAWCDHDRECSEGLTCNPKVNVCVNDGPMSLTGWMRLSPPVQGVIAVEEQYPELSLTNKEDVVLTMHRPIRVFGRVFLQDNLLSSQEATIVAVAAGTVPDLDIHHDAFATQAYQYNYGNGGSTDEPGFEFFVGEENIYDIYVYPTGISSDTEVPSYHVRRSFSQRDNESSPYEYGWDIIIPSIEEYRHITGCVLTSDEQNMPLVGAKIVALDKNSAGMSTKGLTNGNGCFDIVVQPPFDVNPVTYSVRVRPSVENDLVPEQEIAEVVVNPLAPSPEADNPEESGQFPIELGDMLVHGLHELITVQIKLVAEEPTPRVEDLSGKDAAQEAIKLAEERIDEMSTQLLGTTVELAGKVDAGLLRIGRKVEQVTSKTDTTVGMVTLSATVEFVVPPKSYILNVVPTAHSRLGLSQGLHHFYTGQDNPEPIVVTLQKKSDTMVFVEDADGRLVEGAVILAILSGKGEYSETAPLPIRKYEASPDPKTPGFYRLSLDSGSYTLIVDPPVALGLPRRIERDCYVQGASQQRKITLGQPAVVTGLVHGTLLVEPVASAIAEDEYSLTEQSTFVGPITDVKVELYDDIEASGTPDGISPIPTATGHTDDTGRFVLIVPAQ
jgi:hypothetical protein